MAFKANMRAKPTRVAMEELQLHDLQKSDAALDEQKKTIPARHDVATVPSVPARGRDNRMPIIQ